MVKKKEKKMSNSKDLDFDFSDISGKTLPSDEQQEPKVVVKKRQETVVEDDYSLTIPVTAGQFRYLSMRNCTNEEFIEWALCVFPEITVEPESFNTYDKRLRAMKQIIRWHTETFAPLRREKEKIKGS